MEHSKKQIIVLAIGVLISKLGDFIYQIAIMWFVYSKTGSAASAGIVALLYIVPILIFGNIAGIVADKYSNKSILILSDIVRVLLLFIMFGINSQREITLTELYIFTFLLSCFGQFFNLTKTTYLNNLYKNERLKINSLFASIDQLGAILGPILGGVLASKFTLGYIFIIDAITFIFSLLIITLFITRRVDILKKDESLQIGLILCIRNMLNNNLLKRVLMQLIVIMVCTAPLSVFLPYIASVKLQLSATGFGIVESLISIGSLIGSIAPILLKKFKLFKMSSISIFCSGALLLIIALGYGSIIYVALIGAGACISFTVVALISLGHEYFDNDNRGKMTGITTTLLILFNVLGMIVSIVVGNYIDISLLMIFPSIVLMVYGSYLILITGNIEITNSDSLKQD